MSIQNLLTQLRKQIEDIGLQLLRRKLAALQTYPILLAQIKEAQTTNVKFIEIIYEVRKGR